jgi:hypothetical protein
MSSRLVLGSCIVASVALLASVSAIDNGKGIRPPMGWRSWNLYGANVDQQLIQKQMGASPFSPQSIASGLGHGLM